MTTVIFKFLWLICVAVEVCNQVATQKTVTQVVQPSKVDSVQHGSPGTAAPKVTNAAKTVRLVTKGTTTILSDSHATSISPGWLMFGYNGYTIIIAIAALIIVLLICIIIFLLFRRSSKATAASNAVDQAYDGNEVDGAEDDGSGYPPPGAKGPFKIFKSRFRGGGKIQKSYPQRPGKYSSAPYKSGGTGESQIGGAGDEEGGEPYDQEGTGESGYGAMGQNEEATYQEEYPPQGYGRGLKSRAPFRGGRTGSALPPKYPPPFQTKRKKAPYQTLKQSGGPGRFPRPPAKRGLFGIGRGGRGYGAPGQY